MLYTICETGIVSEENLRQAMAKTQEHLRSLPERQNVVEPPQQAGADGRSTLAAHPPFAQRNEVV
jgi:hypothetical protein